MNDKYPELYRDLIEKAAPELVGQLGLTQEQARRAAFLFAEVVRRDWSGSNLYLAKGLSYDISQRDRQIYAEFDGRNHDMLARKHKLTTRRLYQIIDAVGREEFEKQQGKLF